MRKAHLASVLYSICTFLHLYQMETAALTPSVQDALDGVRKSLSDQLGEKISLLIVDDNPKVLRLLERNFSKRDIKVTCVMNFKEAAGKIKNRPL